MALTAFSPVASRLTKLRRERRNAMSVMTVKSFTVTATTTAMFWFTLLLVVVVTLPVSKDGTKPGDHYQGRMGMLGRTVRHLDRNKKLNNSEVWEYFLSKKSKTSSGAKNVVDIQESDGAINDNEFYEVTDNLFQVKNVLISTKKNNIVGDVQNGKFTEKKRFRRESEYTEENNGALAELSVPTHKTHVLESKKELLVEPETVINEKETTEKGIEQNREGAPSHPISVTTTQGKPHPTIPPAPIDLSDFATYAPTLVLPQCIHLPGYNATGIAVIAHCPPHWPANDVRAYCERVHHDAIFSDVPVSDFYGNTYRDVFCAQCNMVVDMEIWTKSVTCNNNPLEKKPQLNTTSVTDISRYIDEDCRVEAIEPPIQLQELIKHCDHPQRPKKRRLVRRDAASVLGMTTNRFTTSFSILMNFGINGQAHILLTSTQQLTKLPGPDSELPSCSDKQIFDPVKKACFLIICQEGYIINAQKQVCEPIDAGPVADTGTEAMSHFKIKLSFFMSQGLLIQIKSGYARFINESIRAVSDSAGIRPDQIIDVTFEDYVNATDNLTKIDYSAPREQAMTLEQFAPGYSPSESSGEELGSGASTDELNDLVHKQMIFLVKPDDAEKKDTSDDMDAYINRITAAFQSRPIMLEFHQLKFNISGAHNNVALIDWCNDGTTRVYLEADFTLTKYLDEELNMTRSGVYINSTDTLYRVGEFDLTVLLQGEWDFLGPVHHNFDGYATVCEKHPRIKDRACPKVPINTTDAVFYPNRHFLFHGKNYSLNEYQFTKEAGTILICVPEVWINGSDVNITSGHLYETHYKLACASENFGAFESAESYLTLIFGVASVVAMALTLFTYSLFRQLRNLPGTNVMNLTAALLLGQAAFFSGSLIEHEELCVAVAVGIHYLFLAAFFWMNVMAFDLYKTFTTKCILPRVREKEKFFPRYMFYAWGCPALLVMACVLIDRIQFFEDLDMDIGYGRVNVEPSVSRNHSVPSHLVADIHASGCWISVPTASLAVFGGPLFFICFVNAIFFGRTILSIRATRKVTKLSRRRSSVSRLTGQADVMLYVRMSTFMGFTWVFGLASSVISGIVHTHTEAVCYVLYIMNILFIVFNCSQGIFIFCAFIFNRRVLELYKSACRCQGIPSPWKREIYAVANGVNCVIPRSVSNTSFDSMGSRAKIIDSK